MDVNGYIKDKIAQLAGTPGGTGPGKDREAWWRIRDLAAEPGRAHPARHDLRPWAQAGREAAGRDAEAEAG